MTRPACPKDALHDQTNLLPRRKLLVVFPALATALLITYIDQQSIGVVLPTIGRDLGCGSTIVWAGTSSLIANTACQVLYGRLSDIFGRKGLLLGCLGLLALGDLLCGVAAHTGPQLYAFRGLAGAANGGIMALVMMVVSDVTTLEQRGRYQGILGSCVGLGNTIGPFVAAGFARGRRTSWRGTFYLLAPLALAEAGLLYVLLPAQTVPRGEPLRAKLAKIDGVGIALSAAGTVLLLVPVSGLGTQFRASSGFVVGLLTAGAVLLAAFVVYEWPCAGLLRRVLGIAPPRLPMLPLRRLVLRSRALAAMMAQNLLVGIVFYSLLYYLPVYFQTARRCGVLASAALVVPLVVPQALASAASGQYISRTGRYGEVLWLGYALWTAGGVLQCFAHAFPLGAVAAVLAVQGCGVGFVFQPTLVAAQAHSAQRDRAVVISARNFVRALGGAAGLALAGAVFANALLRALPADLPADVRAAIAGALFAVPDLAGLPPALQAATLDAYSRAFRSISAVWAGCMVVCLLLMVFIQDRGLKRREEEEAAAEPTVTAVTAVTVVEKAEEGVNGDGDGEGEGEGERAKRERVAETV